MLQNLSNVKITIHVLAILYDLDNVRIFHVGTVLFWFA